MAKRRKNTPKPKQQTITAQIPKIQNGESMKLTNLNGNYVLSEIEKDSIKNDNFDYVAKSTYDINKIKHIYNQILDTEVNSFITTEEEISNLAKNTQNYIDKVLKINGIIKYYINKDNLIGRVVEIIENNINNNYKLNYNYVPKNKKDTKIFEEYKKIIDEFNKQIDIKQLIIDTVLKTYIEGNYIFYLRGDIKNGYGIVNYPLDMIEITSMVIDGEPVVSFKVNELSSKLNKLKTQFKNLKTNKLIDIEDVIESQIKRDYPQEVYDAYVGKDKVALLNPKNIGLVRINNLKTGLYGVSPIFKALSPLLILETIDKSDREILNSRSKKIYYQKTRKELMDVDGNPLKVNEIGYSHTNLLQCMKNNTIVYTSMPYVEGLEILEPKTDLTDSKTKESYIMNVLTALGISFVSSEGSTSITTVKMVFEELIKMVNRIQKQLEPIINKFYRTVTKDNGYPIEFCPQISIEDTKMLDTEVKLKITDLIYSKLGLSYKTTIEMLGLDYQEELDRRKKENEENIDSEVFLPHQSSYTATGQDIQVDKEDSNTNSNGSKKSENIDKQEQDKQRQEIIK